MTVYLDVVMGLNFVVDLLLLMGASTAAGFPVQKGRLALAAGIGAVYAGACLFPGFHFLGNMLWRLVSLGIMGVVAFGAQPSSLRRTVLFVFLSLALGGVAAGMGDGSVWSVAAAAALVLALSLLGFRASGAGQRYVTVSLRHRGAQVTLTALRDTGNTLRDPVTGEQVLVVGARAARQLTGLTRRQLAAPVETLASGAVPGLRLIPYRAVGCSAGMLLAIRVEQMCMGSFRGSALVAFAPEGLDGNGAYQALTGGTV